MRVRVRVGSGLGYRPIAAPDMIAGTKRPEGTALPYVRRPRPKEKQKKTTKVSTRESKLALPLASSPSVGSWKRLLMASSCEASSSVTPSERSSDEPHARRCITSCSVFSQPMVRLPSLRQKSSG